mmetsp:Transcript_90938/g.229231  ORF Transcript_90938/g.229231 Transcript_90938/m.229231 type:complete len:256 (+) Transcript_90938:786-1553(+)
MCVALLLGLRALAAQPSPGENCKRTSERSPSCNGGETNAKPALTLSLEKTFWMRQSTETKLCVEAAVGSSCEVCRNSTGGCGNPGGGRNAGTDKPGGGETNCGRASKPSDGTSDSSRGEEDALVFPVAPQGLPDVESCSCKSSWSRKLHPPWPGRGRAGDARGVGRESRRGDEVALVLGVAISLWYMRCDSAAHSIHCAESAAMDMPTAGEAVVMLRGSMDAFASGAPTGTSRVKLSCKAEAAMSRGEWGQPGMN